jgi:hypothetical protein
MKRWVFNMLCASSALLWIAAMLMWMRSRSATEEIAWRRIERDPAYSRWSEVALTSGTACLRLDRGLAEGTIDVMPSPADSQQWPPDMHHFGPSPLYPVQEDDPMFQPGFSWRRLSSRPDSYAGSIDGKPLHSEWLGFAWETTVPDQQLVLVGGKTPAYRCFAYVLVVPYWAIVGILAILPTLWLLRVSKHARKRWRARHGLCPSCGYDLRASVGRCPECGTAIVLPPIDTDEHR